MSSLEEDERLVQMVQDFMELEAPAAPTTSTCSPLPFSLHQHTCLMLEGIMRSVTEAEMEVFQRALKYVRDLGSERKNSSVKRRLMMRLRMDGYDASLCRSSWLSTPECPGGEYEYIDIVMEGDQDGSLTRLIVDVDFKSQFELARPTQTYTQLFDTLPPIFVGKEEKLKRIVSLLCSSAGESLRARGLHVPPWRKASYVQSKWLSYFHKVSTIPLPSFNKLEVKQKRGPNPSKVKDLGGGGGEVSRRRARGSALSSQFSDFSICC